MNSLPVTDPLEAARLLAAEISGAQGRSADLAQLIRAIDTFMYSLHLFDADVAPIESTECEAPRADYKQLYDTIQSRYPTLGSYREALYPIIKDGTEDKLGIGDAIDDLADVLIELRQVQWFQDQTTREDALASLRWRYDSHLWMHLPPLRHYLEELRRDD